jgi:hypothetical protein
MGAGQFLGAGGDDNLSIKLNWPKMVIGKILLIVE